MLDLGPGRARCLTGEQIMELTAVNQDKNKILRPSPQMFAAPISPCFGASACSFLSGMTVSPGETEHPGDDGLSPR